MQKTSNGFSGQETVFATGFDHPIDVIDDHNGGLLVADHGSGAIWQISYAPSASSSQSHSATASSGSQTSPSTPGDFPLAFLLVIIAFGILVVLVWRRQSRSSNTQFMEQATTVLHDVSTSNRDRLDTVIQATSAGVFLT